MQKNAPQLTPRLAAASELIPQCDCFADIGTDHAYLPVYLCMKNRCSFAVASDIKRGPLERAEKTVKGYQLEDRISLRLGGGVETLEVGEADAISIAGMGGLIIAQILESGRDKIKEDCTVVLQPMTAAPELREYLYKNGWTVMAETLAKEDEKIYNILSVKKAEDKGEPLTETELYLGRELICHRPPHFAEYLERRIKKLENMIRGLSVSDTSQSKNKIEECRRLLAEVKCLI